ncbi:hypothetical protein F4604DRAFT_1946058 [Suillus subluteus]|nr:hypothetical protein F4604DRAFT_1946058 [Suillus subluteus]
MPCTSDTSSSFASAKDSTSINLSVSSPPTSEAPNGSPISKRDHSSLRRTSLVTPNKNRVASPPTSEAPSSSPVLRSDPILRSSSSNLESSPIPRASSPISSSSSPVPRSSSPIPRSSSPVPRSSPPVPRSSSPIFKSDPIRRSSSHIASASPLMTTMLGEGATKHGPRKRAYQYSLLDKPEEPEDDGYFPTKRSKTLFTSFTCHRPADSAVYFTERMLELSRVSHRTFAAKMEYQRLRAEELGLITAIIQDELEESRGHLRAAVIGSKGRPGNQAQDEVGFSRLFPNCGDHEADDDSDSFDASHSDIVSGSSTIQFPEYDPTVYRARRGRGRSASAQVTIPDIERTGSFQPIPFQHNPTSTNSTIERLASAAAMIQTDGDTHNTLLEHQSRQRTSQLPHQVRLRPYSIPSSRATSHRTSGASGSIYGVDGDERPERARRTSKMDLKPTDMRYYSEADQKNIKHARKLIILDMLLESGWQKTSELELIAAECISQASDTSGHVTQSTEGVNKLVFDGLSTIRGKLVNDAERVLSSLGIYPPDDSSLSDDEKIDYIKQRATQLLDDKNLAEYALHGYDPERGKTLVYSAPPFLDLHEDFWFGRNSPFLNPQSRVLISCISWYMYSLTGAAIMCVIRHASEGRLSKTKNVVQFSTEDYSGVAGGIRQAMLAYVAKPELDEHEFMLRMEAHHAKCL